MRSGRASQLDYTIILRYRVAEEIEIDQKEHL